MSVLDPELDVAGAAMVGEGADFVVVGGFSVIANRFVDRPRDRNDLIGLAEIHGELPTEPLAGLDGE